MHAHPRFRAALIVLALALVTAVVGAASSSGGKTPAERWRGVQGESQARTDVDKRKGFKAVSVRQKQAAAVQGVRARWNEFGTPHSLSASDGALATGLGADEVQAARAYLKSHKQLLGVSDATIDSLELLAATPLGRGKVVIFRQRFGDLPAVHDGLVSLAVSDGSVRYVSSSLAENALTGSASLDAAAAIRAAGKALGVELGALTAERTENGWTTYDAGGLTDPARARLGALPTPANGARTVYEVSLYDNSEGDLHGSTSYVDAATGELLVSEDTVDFASDNPAWKAFPAYPPLDYSDTDTRELWCWTFTASVPGCQKAVSVPASQVPWDVDAATNTPTLESRGNNERSTEKWFTNVGGVQGVNFSSAPTRDFVYPWTNLWHQERCDPAVFTPGGNEIDAARANLMAMHNRMHDWSYVLGFTENAWNAQVFNFGLGDAQGDPEHGNAQAGGVVGGATAGFPSRDNANQNSPPDGVSPTTNMYLWQPIPAAFYSPCVDGDYDMSVIAHEYTHMISNRMVAGPSSNLSGNQAGAMGESWSDLAAAEFLNSQRLVPIANENPFAVGPYVTGDKVAGIRNYGMNASPLNYSDVGYDFACNQGGVCTQPTQVHADGEIWSATNYDIRQAFIARYGAGTPAQQASCFSGATPTASCPGNRRWIQLVFDAWLLMASGGVSMLDARDAMLAADQVRFGGPNQDILWNAFAKRGMGSEASSTGSADFDPVPSFESPFADEAEVTFVPAGQASGQPVRLYVGDYEARATPIADADPATALDATFRIVAGQYHFVAVGTGFGHAKFTSSFNAGQVRNLPVNMSRNLAAAANGATASGDGVNLDKLIDDTELTNWASLSGAVAGKQVTVRLDPSQASQQVRRVQISAMLRQNIGDAADTGGQNRFTALRQFEIWTCEAKANVDCADAGDFSLIFTSPDDAFPSGIPRPRAPELIIRSFDVPQTKATHVRLVVLNNQCTGAPEYQGDQDDDPNNSTDCDETTLTGFTGNGERVRVAELQVFSR